MPDGFTRAVRSTSGRAGSGVPSTTLQELGVGVRPFDSPFFPVPRVRSRDAVKPTPSLRLDPCPGLAVPADKLPRLAGPHLKSAKLTTQPSPGGCETQKPRSPPASLRRRPGRHLPQGAAAPGAGRGGARGSGHPPRPAESPDGAGKSPAGPTADDAAAANLSTRAILGSDPPDPTCVARGRSWAEGRSNVAGR